MNGEWLGPAILRAASLLMPARQRAAWLEEWRSELWYVPPRQATRFCLGAFRDSVWLRRNQPGPPGPAPFRLDSPFECLSFLAALAAAGMLLAARLQPWRTVRLPGALTSPAAALICIALFLLARLLGSAPRREVAGARPARSWAGGMFWWTFLAVKFALMLAVVPFSLAVFASLVPIPIVAPLGLMAGCIRAVRWVIDDQRQRCPVCLRMLTSTVHIGSASRTFLEWYGAESMCARGHGLLQAPELPAGCHGRRRWLHLDASWSGVFPGGAGAAGLPR